MLMSSMLCVYRAIVRCWVILSIAGGQWAYAQPPITALEIDRATETIIQGSQQGIALFGLPDQRALRRLDTGLVNVHDLSLSADQQVLCAAGGTPGESGELEFFSWPEGKLLLRRRVASDVLYRCQGASDGRRWLIVSADGSAELLDHTAQPLVSYRGHTRKALAAAFVNEQVAATAGVEGVIHLWSLLDGQSIRSLEGHSGPVIDMVLSPSAPSTAPSTALNKASSSGGVIELVSIGADRTVRLWQPLIGRLVRFMRLDSQPQVVQFNADGTSIVVGCIDGAIHWIDPHQMRITRTVHSQRQPLFDCLLIDNHPQGVR